MYSLENRNENIAIASARKVEAEYKDQLASFVRWDRYRSPDQPIEEFERILGPDVSPLRHPWVTHQIAQDFVWSQNASGIPETTLSDEEGDDLLTAALLHDWGEITIPSLKSTGDVTYDQKTQDHESKERGIVIHLLNTHFPKKGNLPFRWSSLRIFDEIVMKKDSKLGEMFNAIERTGYMNTALRAFHGEPNTKERIDNWMGLTGNTLSNQIPTLITMRNYPYVAWFLNHYSPDITEMFRAAAQIIRIPDASDGKPSFSAEKLRNASDTWTAHHTTS